jgi:hypothetical protein
LGISKPPDLDRDVARAVALGVCGRDPGANTYIAADRE